LILLFMAVTSTKTLFRRFYKYHRLLYVAIILAMIHFAMAQKAFGVFEWAFLSFLLLVSFFKIRQKFSREL